MTVNTKDSLPWTRIETEILLSCTKHFYLKGELYWNLVSDILKLGGYDRTPSSCESKIRRLVSNKALPYRLKEKYSASARLIFILQKDAIDGDSTIGGLCFLIRDKHILLRFLADLSAKKHRFAILGSSKWILAFCS